MGRTRAQDTRNLELHHNKWRVTVHVPQHLRRLLGKSRLKRSLGTDSLAAANQKKHAVVAEMHAELDKAEALLQGRNHGIVEHALAQRQDFQDLMFPQEKGDYLDAAFDGFMGKTAKGSLAAARAKFDIFEKVVTGKGTPIDTKLKDYLREASLKPRTADDVRRSLDVLMKWCSKNGIKSELEALTDEHAAQFFDELEKTKLKSLSNATKAKYKNNLSVYWRFLKRKKIVQSNIWRDIEIKTPKKLNEERERPFSQIEMAKLFMAECPPKLRDVMLIGAFTGARLDTIVDLKVGDITNDCICFKPQKRELGHRFVPQHEELKDMLLRRCKGKKQTDDLFPEWPSVKAKGSLRERSFRTTKEFTAFRRKIGVDDVVNGNRRSRVNFHSFRRWFITRLDRAQVDPRIRDAITGHRGKGMAEGLYSEGPLLDAAREAINFIQLPPLDGSARDELAVMPRYSATVS